MPSWFVGDTPGEATGKDAVERFVRRHWLLVWRSAYAITADVQLAEDAAQEAFVRAFRADTFDSTRPVEPWLRRVAANAAIDLLRRRGRHLDDRGAPAEVGRVGEPEARDDVTAAVMLLPSERRIVVVLHYWLDFSHAEIAKLLDVPPGTVASRLSRAIAELRTQLQGEAHA